MHSPDSDSPDSAGFTRRQLRQRHTSHAPAGGGSIHPAPVTADAARTLPSAPGHVLPWLTPEMLSASSPREGLEGHAPNLLAGVVRDRRIPWALLGPLAALLALLLAYCLTMILWPLHAVAPTADTTEVEPVISAPADMSWPEQGYSGVSVRGVSALANTDAQLPMASLTKVISALTVLDRMPLGLGESGPSYVFTRADQNEYHRYRSRNESALPVPVGESLTQYQLLQATLMGSANNYINHLSGEIWGTNASFAAAARSWLDDRRLGGIEVVEPSGISRENIADPPLPPCPR